MSGVGDENGVFELSTPRAVLREEGPLVRGEEELVGGLADEWFDGEGHAGGHEVREVVAGVEDVGPGVEFLSYSVPCQSFWHKVPVSFACIRNRMTNDVERETRSAESDGGVSCFFGHSHQPFLLLSMSFSYQIRL